MTTLATKGFSIAEPGDEDTDCAFCKTGIPHTVMEITGKEGWLAIPVCIQCQTAITNTLVRDLAEAAGCDDTPMGIAEFMSQHDWNS